MPTVVDAQESTQAQSPSGSVPTAVVRRAKDCRIEKPYQPGQAHRAAASSSIDYRLQELTDGAARAISTTAGHFADKSGFSSPWHYHDCDLQIAMVLEGSIDLGYEANSYGRASKGDILFIPGHVLHDVSYPSADYVVAEITFPGTFGTVEAAMPAPGIDTPARTWGSGAAKRESTSGGIVCYRYPVAGPYADRFQIMRQRCSRIDALASVNLSHADRYRFTFVMDGRRQVSVGGETYSLSAGDLLMIPRGGTCEGVSASEDYSAIEVVLLA